MPLVQGGPPQWAWERPPGHLKWDVSSREDRSGRTVYELRVNCGLEIVRWQFFTEDELRELQSLIAEELSSRATTVAGR